MRNSIITTTFTFFTIIQQKNKYVYTFLKIYVKIIKKKKTSMREDDENENRENN